MSDQVQSVVPRQIAKPWRLRWQWDNGQTGTLTCNTEDQAYEEKAKIERYAQACDWEVSALVEWVGNGLEPRCACPYPCRKHPVSVNPFSEGVSMSAHTQVSKQISDYVKEAEAKDGWSIEVPAKGKTIIFLSPDGDRITIPASPGELVFKRFEEKINEAGLRIGAVRRARQSAAKTTVAASVEVQEHQAAREAESLAHNVSAAMVRLQKKASRPGHQGIDGKFYCPECADKGNEWSTHRSQGLGAHRSRVHSVAGTSRGAKAFVTKTASNGSRLRVLSAPTTDRAPLLGVVTAMDLLLNEIKLATDNADPEAYKTLKVERDQAIAERDKAFTDARAAESDQGSARAKLAEITKVIEQMPMSRAYGAIIEIVGQK